MSLMRKNGQLSLLAAAVGLVLLGLLPLMRGALDSPPGGAPSPSAGLIAFNLALGIAAALLAYRIDIRRLYEWSPYLLLGTVLAAALFALPFLRGISGMKGAVALNDSLLRLAFVVYAAGLLALRKGTLKNLRRWYQLLLYFVPAFAILLLQPRPGDALILCAILTAGLYLAGGRSTLVWGGALCGLLLAPLFFSQAPILDAFRPWKGSPISLYASTYAPLSYASGGFWGAGSHSGYMHILLNTPEFSSFVLPALAERSGIPAALGALILMVVILLAGLGMTSKSPDLYPALLSGLASVNLASAALVNLASTFAVLPAQGIAFPLLDASGSTFLTSCMSLGLLLGLAGKLWQRKLVVEISPDTCQIETCTIAVPATEDACAVYETRAAAER